MIAVIDPSLKRPRFSTVEGRGSYSEPFMCPTTTGWKSEIPSFIWNNENLGNIFPLELSTASIVIRQSLLPATYFAKSVGPMLRVPQLDATEEFGTKYSWELRRKDTNGDGDDDYIEAVNIIRRRMGKFVDFKYQFKKGEIEPSWSKESDLLGLTVPVRDVKAHSPIPLCRKATGGGE